MLRKCPRCSKDLRPLYNGRTTLDHCETCRGNFLEVGDSKETFGPWTEPAHWLSTACAREKKNENVQDLACPAGHGSMQAYDLDWDEHQLEVDVCAKCKGMWLDAAEGGRLADLMSSFHNARSQADAPGIRLYFFQLLTGFPIEVFHPVRRKPVAVYGLIASLFTIYAFQVVRISSGTSVESFFRNWALVPSTFWEGNAPWTMLTHAFLHVGAFHLLGNLYSLKIFGDNVEERLGSARFLGLYAVALFCGGLAHLLAEADSATPMLGASGAISGVMAAYFWYFPKIRLWMVVFFVRFQIPASVYFVVWTLIQIAMATRGVPGVAWYAHMGGFAGGWIFLWVRHRLLGRYPVRYPSRINPG